MEIGFFSRAAEYLRGIFGRSGADSGAGNDVVVLSPDPAPAVVERALDATSPADMYNAGFANWGVGGFSAGKSRQWLIEYEQNCHLRAPFSRVAEDAALIPWKLFKRLKTSDRRKEVRDHAILDLLRNPEPSMTGFYWRQLVRLHLDLQGEFFLWIEFGAVRGYDFPVPVALRVIPPHWVTKVPGFGDPYFHVCLPGRTSLQLSPGEVIWHRRPRPSNPYTRGLGIAPSTDDEVAQLEWMAKFNNSFFRNGATLGTVLGIDDPKANWDRIRQQFEDRHQGAGQAFRTAVIPGKVSAQNLTTGHKDLDYYEGIKLNRDIVRQTVGTPPEILGHTDNSNKATSTVADHIHQSYGLLPRCVDMDEALNCFLVPLFGEDGLILESDNPVKETKEFILERADRGLKSGAITINKWRAEWGMDPEPDGDVYLIPKNTRIVAAGDLKRAAEAEQRLLEVPQPGSDPIREPDPAITEPANNDATANDGGSNGG